MEFERKPTGKIELRLQGHLFAAEERHPEVVIPRELLRGFRLSEIPEDLAIRPSVSGPAGGAERERNYALFRFTDGVAWAQVEATEEDAASGIDRDLRQAALTLAIAERQAQLGDVEEDDLVEDERDGTLRYLVTISRDLEIGEAITAVERTVAELEKRRDEIFDMRSRGASSGT